MKFNVIICLCLASHAASYTPRMFRPGGKYYVPPKTGPGSDGIDEQTRAQLSGILNGILSNLQHSKAALPQVAQDIVHRFSLSGKDAGLKVGLRDMIESLNADESDENDFNSASKDMQSKAKTVLTSVLQKIDSGYTPRMFAPGGKYYNPPHFGRSNGGISQATKDQVSGILKGILGNLMKHKAALTQAKELVQKFHLDDKSNIDVTQALMDVNDELRTPTSGHGLEKFIEDEKAFSNEDDRSHASAVLALVIQQANVTYIPGSLRPKKYSGYIPSRSRGLGISKGTRDQVAGILKGILENLTKHKAALNQVTDDVKREIQGNPEVEEGLKEEYTALTDGTSALAGASPELQGHFKTVLAGIFTKVTKTNVTKTNVTKH